MHREGTLGVRREQVLEAHVGECAAHHHFVIAATRAVRVEVDRLDAMRDQVLPGGERFADRSGGRDVVGGDAVAQKAQHPRAANVGDRLGLYRHAVEVGCAPDVRGSGLPGEAVALGHGKALPPLVALEHLGVGLVKHRRLDRRADDVVHLLGGRPDVAQEDGLAVFAGAQWFGVELDVDLARERVGDHEGRGGEVVGAHFLLDPAFEVAVPRQHRAHDQVSIGDRR